MDVSGSSLGCSLASVGCGWGGCKSSRILNPTAPPPSYICVCLLYMVLSLAGLPAADSVPSFINKERCCASNNPRYRLHVPILLRPWLQHENGRYLRSSGSPGIPVCLKQVRPVHPPPVPLQHQPSRLPFQSRRAVFAPFFPLFVVRKGNQFDC